MPLPVATLVRPRHPSLRDQLLGLLAGAGIGVERVEVLPAAKREEEVVSALRARSRHLLVIPFRQPRGEGDETRHGLELLQRLEQEAPFAASGPVVMPVTQFGAGAVHMLLGNANPDETLSRETRHRILPLLEDELGAPETVRRLQLHLRLHGRG